MAFLLLVLGRRELKNDESSLVWEFIRDFFSEVGPLTSWHRSVFASHLLINGKSEAMACLRGENQFLESFSSCLR